MVHDFNGYGCQVSICSRPRCSGEIPVRKVHTVDGGLRLELKLRNRSLRSTCPNKQPPFKQAYCPSKLMKPCCRNCGLFVHAPPLLVGLTIALPLACQKTKQTSKQFSRCRFASTTTMKMKPRSLGGEHLLPHLAHKPTTHLYNTPHESMQSMTAN